MYRIGRSIETESRLVVAEWRGREMREAKGVTGIKEAYQTKLSKFL